MLRRLTLGIWKEYSSISHASYDGLVSLFPFISRDKIPHEHRPELQDADERYISLHIARAAGLLLCVLTEIQHFWKFAGANIDKRISEIWSAIVLLPEVKELFDYRYKGLLQYPIR